MFENGRILRDHLLGGNENIPCESSGEIQRLIIARELLGYTRGDLK